MQPDLLSLAARVEKLDRPDRTIDRQVSLLLHGGRQGREDADLFSPSLTEDRRAVVSLIECVLPGWKWTARSYDVALPNGGTPCEAELTAPKGRGPIKCHGSGTSPARALLAALLRAKAVMAGVPETDDLKLVGRLRWDGVICPPHEMPPDTDPNITALAGFANEATVHGKTALRALEMLANQGTAIRRLVRERDEARNSLIQARNERDEDRQRRRDLHARHAVEITALRADRDRLAKLVAEMREALSDATEALATKLTAEDRATKLRPPYEHPLSALDRARALLATTEPTTDAALRAIHEQQGG